MQHRAGHALILRPFDPKGQCAVAIRAIDAAYRKND
jgi:hypothetical protein